MTVSCVLFDLDNTLTQRSESVQKFSERFYEEWKPRLAAHVTLDEVARVMHEGDGGGYKPKPVMFAEICERLAWTDAPDAETMRDYWYRVSPGCMLLRDDAEAVLTRLRDDGFRLGIITNGPTYGQNAVVDALGIRHYFEVVIVSETVGIKKPDAGVFALTLAQLGVTADEAIYVGDHPINDMQGARNASIRGVWITGVHDWPDDMLPADVEISALSQLFDLAL
jgi:putative hydrolase of the HAD superfamily